MVICKCQHAGKRADHPSCPKMFQRPYLFAILAFHRHLYETAHSPTN